MGAMAIAVMCACFKVEREMSGDEHERRAVMSAAVTGCHISLVVLALHTLHSNLD